MRLAFVFNYHLADNVEWKKIVVQELIDSGHEIDVYYGKTFLFNYVKTYLIKRKFSSASHISKRLKKKTKKNQIFFKELGVPVYKVKNYNSERDIKKISSKNYDFIIAAIDQILSKSFIKNINSKILNIHYATLPDVKGINAIEWNYLINKKCELTLHYINSGIDTGQIIKTQEIGFNKGDGFFMMREKLQEKIPIVLTDFFKKSNKEVFENQGGKLYTYMHQDIQEIIKGAF